MIFIWEMVLQSTGSIVHSLLGSQTFSFYLRKNKKEVRPCQSRASEEMQSIPRYSLLVGEANWCQNVDTPGILLLASIICYHTALVKCFSKKYTVQATLANMAFSSVIANCQMPKLPEIGS